MIDERFLDSDYWARIAEDAQNAFQVCEHYLVSPDVLEEFSKSFYNGAEYSLVKSFKSDAGIVPVRVVDGKTNFFALQTEKYVIYPKQI